MQQKSLNLKSIRIGCLPIIDSFMNKMRLQDFLSEALQNKDYAEAILIIAKNILINREALYGFKEWAAKYDLREFGDDRLGRALDRLFTIDRATLQTKIVLGAAESFSLNLDQIHSDSTSITLTGDYREQNSKAIKLKRGYSKDHRPDLKQLIYNLCITHDGAVPIHFKCFDGNRTDDSFQLEIWSGLRTLLQRPDFTYVADSKFCVEKTMLKIDSEHGLFVTMVPKTRTETVDFSQELDQGNVRWQKILRKKSHRHSDEFDTFEVAIGEYRLREGFQLYWYRSNQKAKRDASSRKNRISTAIDKIENLNLNRLRGPKTSSAIEKKIEKILIRYQVQNWLSVEVKFDSCEKFKALSRGKPTKDTQYKKIDIKSPRLVIRKKVEEIAKSRLMDGIFPLATNKKDPAVEILKIYKYQPTLEKRHVLLKTTQNVAPIWLKKNTRIEALMFVEYIAQMTAALMERELRNSMKKNGIEIIASLPENRSSKSPTFDQLLRIFDDRLRHQLIERGHVIKKFSEPLSKIQIQILDLLKVSIENFT